MKDKRKRYIKIGGLITLLIVIMLGIIGGLIGIPAITHGATSQQKASKPVNVTIYLTTEAIGEIFQNRVDQILDGETAGAVKNLPAQDRSSVLQMVNTILQPSASLTSIIPQQKALITNMQLQLYAGDPHPINASMQITFNVLSSSTMQVNVKPLPGSPALANGPVASIRMPLGVLSSINMTPSCSSTVLAINLQIPLSLSSNQTSTSSTQAQPTPVSPSGQAQKQSSPVSVSVGIPASSLALLGNSVGSVPIDGTMSANNIHILVQGQTLHITSDLYMGSDNIGSSNTVVQPGASNGSLVVHVLNTTVKLFQLISFPYDMYNQQLETMLNAKLQSAFAHKFSITQAGIGPNNQTSCVPDNSLILTGATNLG
jgi:hypothetical protein